MEVIKIESSNIDAIGYDLEKKLLEIVFKSGARYRYFRVDQEVFSDLMDSDSKGRFFASHIKGRFDFERVPTESPPAEQNTATKNALPKILSNP